MLALGHVGKGDASISGGGWQLRVAGGGKMPNSKGNRRPDDGLGLFIMPMGSFPASGLP